MRLLPFAEIILFIQNLNFCVANGLSFFIHSSVKLAQPLIKERRGNKMSYIQPLGVVFFYDTGLCLSGDTRGHEWENISWIIEEVWCRAVCRRGRDRRRAMEKNNHRGLTSSPRLLTWLEWNQVGWNVASFWSWQRCLQDSYFRILKKRKKEKRTKTIKKEAKQWGGIMPYYHLGQQHPLVCFLRKTLILLFGPQLIFFLKQCSVACVKRVSGPCATIFVLQHTSTV